jgi:acetyl-CoA synthetase
VGFSGTVWRVHPNRASTPSLEFYRSVDDLPEAPDAAFLAVPRQDAATVVAALARRGAGGFVCFTAGFSETATAQGAQLTEDLIAAADTVPFFGPNCYGFVNFFDSVALWPDQVVGSRPQRGVALLCQSGTIALTLMFNDRSLPIGYLFTVGNQTRLAVEDLIETLSADSRVTAFGLYLEGIQNVGKFAAAVDTARRAGKPIAVVKSGRTAAAARTAHSHTGALAGEDSVFEAYCRQAGLARCDTLATLCETLKVLHAGGPLAGRKILVLGASGGDMAMTADVARNLALDFAPLPAGAVADLREVLTDRVTIANPFDIHTYLWFDPPALRRVFTSVLRAGYDAVAFMLDCPPDGAADTAAFDAVIAVFIAAAGAGVGPGAGAARAALLASLPETLGRRVRENCLSGGVVPLQGLREALEALTLAAAVGSAWAGQRISPRLQKPRAPFVHDVTRIRALSEAAGKAALAEFGVPVSRAWVGPYEAAVEAAAALGFPVVIKAAGEHLEHKTEVGGVALNLRTRAEAAAAVARLAAISPTLLVEPMIADGVAEVLAGISVDAQFGQVLVIGAGGVLTEILSDSITVLPPWTQESVLAALGTLGVAKLLTGYRGRPAGDQAALVSAILGVARYAAAHLETLVELDVNPLIVRPAGLGVVAVDALIRLQQE